MGRDYALPGSEMGWFEYLSITRAMRLSIFLNS